jgi:hypothetical protein
MVDIFSSSRTSRSAATTSSKEHTEKIVSSATTATAAAFFQAFQTVLVIFGSLFCVTQNSIGCIDFLEFVFITSLIWVMFYGKLTVGLFDFFFACILFYLN